MKAKVSFLLSSCLLFSLTATRCVAGNQKSCTTSEEKRALDEADNLKDWDALHRSFIRFGHCDDGAIAEGYSDTVGRLLAGKWEHIGNLGKLVVSDKKFENFVLRHIDETLPTDTLKVIANKAENNCPADETALCRKILQNAQAAGEPAPVQPTDFGQRAKDEEKYSASLVVAPLAKGPKYLKFRDGRQQVVYAIESEYPAEDVLSFISAELKKREWKPLPQDFFSGLPSSHQRGWTFFEDHTQKPWTGVFAWNADWEDDSHDIVLYQLTYESPDNSTRNLKNLLVIAVFIPAEIAAKMKHVAANFKGEQKRNPPPWQSVDQLCGVLEFATPKKKTITETDGKTETRLYANVLKDAKVALYMGTASDEGCCEGKTPAGNTTSDKRGWFELSGFQSGWYWLYIESNNFSTTIPLHITSDFNVNSCHARSVGRIFTVDSKPPKVETRIY